MSYKPFIKKIDLKEDILKQDFDITISRYQNQQNFNLGYHYYTDQVRSNMDDDEYRKRNFYLITNPFEDKIPDNKDDLFNYSNKKFKTEIKTRDFYKIWEMLSYFNLANDSKLSFLGLNENGGFLQGIKSFRDTYYNSKNDKYYIHTFNKKTITENIKDLNKNNIPKFDNTPYENFISDDLTNKTNDIIKSFPNKYNLITSNSSFDNENEQFNHLLSYIIIILEKQNDKGSSILRLNDIMMFKTLKLLNILDNCYENLYICKPLFSRSYTNEKYLICHNMNIDDKNRNNLLTKLNELLDNINKNKKYYIFDIITRFNMNLNNLNDIIHINKKLTAEEHMNINKISNYRKGKNYFGELYHEYKDIQNKSNKWWQESFYEKNINDLNNNIKNLIE